MVANKSKRVPGSKEEGKALRRRRIIGENILGTCMAAPPFLAFVFFSVIPMAVSLVVSFMDLHGVVVSTARPVGLENYKKLLQDPTTYTSLVNTAKYCIHSTAKNRIKFFNTTFIGYGRFVDTDEIRRQDFL